MKKLFAIKRFIFYLWVVLPYLFLWVSHDVHTYKVTLLAAMLNNVWRAMYVVVVNFIFFEYVIPFVLRKRQYVVYNVLLGMMWLLFL